MTLARYILETIAELAVILFLGGTAFVLLAPPHWF
jgi:hypothetical protein